MDIKLQNIKDIMNAGKILSAMFTALALSGTGMAAYNNHRVMDVYRNATRDVGAQGTAMVVFAGSHDRGCKAVSFKKQSHLGAPIYISGEFDYYSQHGLPCGEQPLLANDTLVFAQAVNTHDNGIRSAEWLKDHGYRSVYLVTDDYHMPRSILELRNGGYNGHIIPVEVQSNITQKEYVIENLKYFIRLAGIPVSRNIQFLSI